MPKQLDVDGEIECVLGDLRITGLFEPYEDTPVFGQPSLTLHWLTLTVLQMANEHEYAVRFHDRILTSRRPSEVTVLAAATQYAGISEA